MISTDNKIILAILTGTAGLAASVIGRAENWHAWPVPVAAAACIDVILANRTRPGAASRQPDVPPGSGAPHLAGQHWENPVNAVRVPSSAAEYDFLFSAVVRWRPTDAVLTWREQANANPGAQAVNAVLGRVRTAAAMERPESHREAQNRIAAALGTALPDSTGRVEAWATNVSLTLPPDDLERVNKLADLRKEADLWARRREFERERRSYFGEDVFKDTGSAVMWMLAQTEHGEQDVERAVRLIGPLALLSAAANESPVPELYRHLLQSAGSPASADHQQAGNGHVAVPFGPDPEAFREQERIESLFDNIADVIRQYAADSSPDRRAGFAGRLARAFESVGQPETARRFRAAFAVPEPARGTSDATNQPDTPDASAGPGSDTGDSDTSGQDDGDQDAAGPGPAADDGQDDDWKQW